MPHVCIISRSELNGRREAPGGRVRNEENDQRDSVLEADDRIRRIKTALSTFFATNFNPSKAPKKTQGIYTIIYERPKFLVICSRYTV